MRDFKRGFPIAFLPLAACAALLAAGCGGTGANSALPNQPAAIDSPIDNSLSSVDNGQPVSSDTSLDNGQADSTDSRWRRRLAASPTPVPTATPTAAPSSTPAPTATPSATPTAAPTATPTPVATASPTAGVTSIWHIGNSYVLPSTSDGDYQKPTSIDSNNGIDFSMTRNYNGTNNYRNQVNPTNSSGSLLRLTPGTTYDWKFQTVANMAPDVNGSQNLIWQIHDYNAGTSPITVLGTQNINDGGTVWYFHSGGGTWKGKYTQGAVDNWEIRIKIASDSTGTEMLYRNGALVTSQTGANYSTQSQGNPWWNFGPYEWDWKSTATSGQVSDLSSLDFVFNQMNFGSI